MFNWKWIDSAPEAPLMILLSTLGIYAALLLLTRLAGLRSFSKMSSFDFAITVAMGSVLAGTILAEDPPLLHGVLALASLFGIQFVISKLRRHTKTAPRIVDNEALLLMAGAEVIADNLDRARMTTGDLNSKLRGAGVTHPKQVLAVIMETTGDISVLLNERDAWDPALFADVRDAERLKQLGESS